MPKKRTGLEKAAGKLISAVQKEWGEAMGEPGAVVSEDAMHKCHEILGHAKSGTLREALRGQSVADYLGHSWVRQHPAVLPAIRALEKLIGEARHG